MRRMLAVSLVQAIVVALGAIVFVLAPASSAATDCSALSGSGSLPVAAVGVPYKGKVYVRDGTAPYKFKLVAGMPPLGLTMSGAGVVSGVPLQSGTVTFTVQATDSSTPTPCVLTFPVSIRIYPIDTQVGQELLYCAVDEAAWLLNGGPPPTECMGVIL